MGTSEMTRLLYLHGFASSPASKKAQFFRERFARFGIELEIPDLAGGNFEHLTISGQMAVVEAIAQGGAISLIGSSLGGYLAALYAAHHPQVEKLVIMAPAFCFARSYADSIGPDRLEAWKRTG